MVKDDAEQINKILRELEKNKFVKLLMERWFERAKMSSIMTALTVFAILLTILLLNLMGKLTMESNGWIIAALIGYLFGRVNQK